MERDKSMGILEAIRTEIDKRYAEYRAKMKTDDFTYYEGMADALDLFEQFLDTLPEQEDSKAMLYVADKSYKIGLRDGKASKEQIVNLPKWQRLKNIDSYSDGKTWKDDKMLFVADSEGYLYACSIRELFDKLPKEE